MFLLMGLAITLMLTGCSQVDEQSVAGPSSQKVAYEIWVTYNSQSLADAYVIAVFQDDTDTLLKCNASGFVSLESQKPLRGFGAMNLGLSGFTSSTEPGVIAISVEVVPEPDTTPVALSTYYFGVYDTDGNGDVRFRYLYNFSYYYCSVYLPWWLLGDKNPNHWDGWDLTDFLPWNGKKLLVPQTYQYYCQVVYGFSISNALILVSTS